MNKKLIDKWKKQGADEALSRLMQGEIHGFELAMGETCEDEDFYIKNLGSQLLYFTIRIKPNLPPKGKRKNK